MLDQQTLKTTHLLDNRYTITILFLTVITGITKILMVTSKPGLMRDKISSTLHIIIIINHLL